jgi:hypothetical protein
VGCCEKAPASHLRTAQNVRAAQKERDYCFLHEHQYLGLFNAEITPQIHGDPLRYIHFYNRKHSYMMDIDNINEM